MIAALAPLRAQHEGVVEGLVVGPLGEPLPNVEVVARPDPHAAAKLGASRTDGEGVFRIGRLPTDQDVVVVARLAGHTTAVGHAVFEPGARQAALTLRLWQANTVRGRVVDAAGRPVAGAAVLGTKDRTGLDGAFLPPETASDAAGAFELVGVPIGDCVIRAWASGFELRELSLHAVADTAVEVTLVPGKETLLSIHAKGAEGTSLGSVEARVTGTRGGVPFAMPRALERATLDDKGRLVLSGLPRAEYEVYLQSPGHRFEPNRATTKNGTFVHMLPFVATQAPEMTLRGRVCDGEGEPVVGQRLVARSARGEPGSAAVTDEEGTFALKAPLARGQQYDLFLAGSRWVLQQPRPAGTADMLGTCWQEFADPDRELALFAAPSAFVAVRLVGPDGRPAPFTRARLQRHFPTASPQWHTLADVISSRDGTLDFGGLRAYPNELRVRVSGPRGCGVSEVFLLRAGDRDTIDVVLSPSGTVRGRMLDAAGQPVAGARLTLSSWDLDARQPGDSDTTCVLTDRDGRFVFAGVAPGGHRVATGRYEPTGDVCSEPLAVESAKSAEVELRLPK